MANCQDSEFCPDAEDGAAEPVPGPNAGAESRVGLRRRTFLKAAALGGAAVGGLKLGALSGLAHTDNKSPCSAGDIELTGGQIVNEPCECAGGTFPAVAQFQVRNDNNANRLNITLHMGPGGTFGGQDFVLRTGSDGLSGSCSIGGLGTTQTMYAFLGNLSCDFASECYPGTVIAFQTANNQGDSENCSVPLTKYPGGQCRRQEVCIIGFDADLTCSTVGCGGAPSDGCTVPCGGILYLQASAVGGTVGSNGTYRYVVTAPDGEAFDSGAGQGGSFCFTITNPTSGTYTLQAFDSNGCVRTDTTGVTVVEIPAPVLVAGTPDCAGTATFSVTNCDPSLTYTYESADGAPSPQSGVGLCSATFSFPQDGADHSVTCTASNGDPACDQTDSASVHINTPVTVDLAAGGPDCAGTATFTVTACDPSLTYTYSSATGTPTTSTSGLGLCEVTYTFPQDGADHTVTVTASNGITACDQSDSATVHVNTPITVVLGNPVSDCSGDVTLTAEASGGSGSGYTFEWSVNGVPQESVTGETLFLLPQLDGECREVTVTATDDAGCVSDPDSVSFSQCVETTVCTV